jgi:hypothetical protein
VEVFEEEMKIAFQMSDLGTLLFTWGSKCTRMTPTSRFDRLHTPKHTLSWEVSPTRNQLLLLWKWLKLSYDITAEEVDATHYLHLVGSFNYLVYKRLDLAFSISYVS